MYTFVSFTVAELFDKVWQTPMVKLIHDVGVSDVAVAKVAAKPASLSQIGATGQNLKSSDSANQWDPPCSDSSLWVQAV